MMASIRIQTTPEPKRTVERVTKELARYFDWDEDSEQVNSIAEALKQAEAEGHRRGVEKSIKLVGNPYGDEVQCYGSDEPLAVADKMVAALNKLQCGQESK